MNSDTICPLTTGSPAWPTGLTGSPVRSLIPTRFSVLNEKFDHIATCGPTPMMKAVARYAKQQGIYCEASLENMMACGLGACLCCVEKVKKDGTEEATNLCVCKDGPVFNVDRLLWQI